MVFTYKQISGNKEKILSKKLLRIRIFLLDILWVKLITSSIGQSNADALLDFAQGWHAFRI